MGAEAQQGIMMRAALVAMLLVLPAAVAYSSGSTSAYASGKSSAYASGASAYASASKAAPSPPAGTTTIQVIKATVTLPGVTAAAFNANTAAGKKVRLAFQTTVAKALKICGKGSDQCTSDDVVITGVSRRRSGAKVEFYVKTTSAANAKAGATKLNTALTHNGGADFVTSLKSTAKGLGATELEKVTGITVTKAPAAGTVTKAGAASSKTAVAAASVTAGVSLASLAFAALALQ